MINILIRTHRVSEFNSCIESIKAQTFRDINLIIAIDQWEKMFVPVQQILHKCGFPFELIRVQNTGVPYHWNFYCNNLKSRVKDGWFFYLDDDDALIDKFCLEQIRPHLGTTHGTICQFMRGKKSKPNFNAKFWMKPENIVRGFIGGSCIFLHHTHKEIANWDGAKAADYRFIRDVAHKLPLRFIPIVVVKALNHGLHGALA